MNETEELIRDTLKANLKHFHSKLTFTTETWQTATSTYSIKTTRTITKKRALKVKTAEQHRAKAQNRNILTYETKDVTRQALFVP